MEFRTNFNQPCLQDPNTLCLILQWLKELTQWTEV